MVNTEVEEWRDTPWPDERYQASSFGRIRNKHTGNIRKLSVSRSKTGAYHVLGTSINGQTVTHLVSWLVLEAFSGPRPEGAKACHGPLGSLKDTPDNLSWDTQSKNIGEDRRRDGTSIRGEKLWSAKLTAAQVIEIRTLAASGETQSALSRRFGVKQAHISKIVRREAWAHVEE
jgi:NUMOD4 motif